MEVNNTRLRRGCPSASKITKHKNDGAGEVGRTQIGSVQISVSGLFF